MILHLSPPFIQFVVIAFAKLTGDYVSLSTMDIRVMALTVMLEIEVNGFEHINDSPKPPPTPGSIQKVLMEYMFVLFLLC